MFIFRFYQRLLVYLIVFIPLSCYSQYKVIENENFELGKIRSNLIMIGDSQKISVGKWDMFLDMPPEFRHSAIGQYGLSVKAQRLPDDIRKRGQGLDEYLSGVCFPNILDRKLLHDTGRVLFHADFYITSTGNRAPHVAVLAMAPLTSGNTAPQSMYRFGIGGDNNAYFSYVKQGSAEPNILKKDMDMINMISRPGWHRFAILFEGQDTIHCYIDGQEPKFSPVKDSSMEYLQLGILIAEFHYDYSCYIDNACIQCSPIDAPMPESPYAGQVAIATPTSATIASTEASGANSIKWLDTAKGWEQAVQTQTPMFIYFQTPGTGIVNEFNAILETNPDARRYLQKYIPISIDINQAQGSKIAQHYGVFRVPAVIIMGVDGKEISSAVFIEQETWDIFASQLNQPTNAEDHNSKINPDADNILGLQTHNSPGDSTGAPENAIATFIEP